jgi:hypothetical protein
MFIAVAEEARSGRFFTFGRGGTLGGLGIPRSAESRPLPIPGEGRFPKSSILNYLYGWRRQRWIPATRGVNRAMTVDRTVRHA